MVVQKSCRGDYLWKEFFWQLFQNRNTSGSLLKRKNWEGDINCKLCGQGKCSPNIMLWNPQITCILFSFSFRWWLGGRLQETIRSVNTTWTACNLQLFCRALHSVRKGSNWYESEEGIYCSQTHSSWRLLGISTQVATKKGKPLWRCLLANWSFLFT